MAQNAGGFLRTIPIQESLPATQNIAAYDDAVEILKKQKLIVITDCICRKMRETVETGCGKSITAKAILRLLPTPPTRIASGEILFEGRDILEMDEPEIQQIRGNQIAMIFIPTTFNCILNAYLKKKAV